MDPANNRDGNFDVLVDKALIKAIDHPGKISLANKDNVKTMDATGMVVAPGFIDMHVHFREPGFEYKETIETGCQSAVAGGFTSVAVMPNTLLLLKLDALFSTSLD